MDNRLELKIDKCGDLIIGRVVGRNTGATRVVGFMDFGEEIESGSVRIRDMEEEDVLAGKTTERANSLKEGKEALVVGVSRVTREKKISGRF